MSKFRFLTQSVIALSIALHACGPVLAEISAANLHGSSTSANIGTATQSLDSRTDASLDQKIAEVENHISLFQVRQEDFETLQKIITDNPNDCYAHFLLGRCFERNGLIDLATEQFSIASKLETKPEDILKRLRHHIEAGELSDAYNMKSIVWEKAPNDPNLKLLQAMFMQEGGDMGNAEAAYRALLARNDCPLGAATALATICMDRKDWNSAVQLAEKDIAMNHHYMAARMAKGQSLLALGHSKEAIETCRQTLAEHPFNRRMNLLMYQAYRTDRNYEDALRCALRNLAGSDWISYFEDAKERVRELLKILPEKKSSAIVDEVSQSVDKTNYAMKFHFYLEQVYRSLRRSREAMKQNDIAMSMAPEFQPNWYERGRIKANLLGDYTGAAKDFWTAFRMQHSDYKSFLAAQRLKSRVLNDHRDLALQLKETLRKK